MGLLQGKCALITGAASIAGIGFAKTRRFAAEGCRLAIVDADIDAIQARARELISAGCNSADVFQLNVTSEDEWIELAEKLNNLWGGLDILINAADRIRENSVLPGIIQTDMQEKVGEVYEHSAYDEAVRSIPIARAGTADDVASAILFLASDDASYIAGSELIVDGGLAAT